MNLFPKEQDTPPHEDVMKIARSLIETAMKKDINLTLPNSNGNTHSVNVTGTMTNDSVEYKIDANVDYSFSDVSVNGNVVGILKIDSSKLNPNVPAQYSEESSSESPYKFELDKETDLKITVGDNDNYSIEQFVKDLKDDKSKLAIALRESYKQLLKDALTMVANFFKEGYSIETKDLSISIKGDLKYDLATPKTRDINFNNYYEQFGNLFNNLFKYISLENIVLDVNIKENINLSGTNINGHIIVGAEYAKLEPAKVTVYRPDPESSEQTFIEDKINGIKASISFDVSSALNINNHEIYAKGYFDGVSGALGGVVADQGYTINAYLRFDGTNYNLTPMIEKAIKNHYNPSGDDK